MHSPFPFQELINWYEKNGRTHLPWRDYDFSEKDLGYRVWLSEIFLQQTQASRVCEYFSKVIEKYPTIEILARTSYEDFFEDYKGLGYYSRAKNMLKTAKIITEQYQWYFPKKSEELVQLPWIWPYTAEAIRAFAFQIPTLSFDTNLEKIFSRYYFGTRFQKLRKSEKQQILQDFLKTDISARDFNNACMDFWSLVCVNQKNSIDFENYPLSWDTFAETKWNLEPEKKKISSCFPSDEAEIFIILHENHKEYFSESEAEFQAFKLPKTSQKDKRAYIKKYFLETYNLQLSVRPPHIKDYKNKTPYMVFNAQIQKWENDFFVFKKEDIEKFY